ncbi:HlyD family secretion protein [Pantoea ananatis]|uniref:HlyD family secretion protein n=1 Tax=Pantoea ananas TaxID=553 RepID=UPI000CF4F0F1|nr:HlyD family efflux transporter periplasmic adaptor subunit [Pantoea ananatis]PQK95196.1 secretion protein HlyD [Pantoea ananatis]
MDLFRKEALDRQNGSAYGDIVIPASLGISFSAGATLLLVTLIISLLYFGHYTRKAHLSGIVMPSTGLIKITPHYAGYVTGLMVSEGQHVSAGAPLYHISGERYDGQGAGTLAAISSSLKTQYSMLVSQQIMEQHDNQQQQNSSRQRMASLKPQIKSAEDHFNLAEYKARLAESVMQRYKKLVSTHYVSDIEYQQKQMEVSAAQENVESQRMQLLQLHTTLESAEEDLNHLIAQGESRQSELRRQLQSIKQQQAELAAQESFTLTSPVSGTVAAVLIKQGQSARASEAVMTLVPDDAQLQIELYATSQNSGFIRPGQRVSLRFSAFPYQKFGVQHGVIREISRTTLSTSDLLSVSPVTWKENEGHYRVIVLPQHDYIMAYGRSEPLRPGMTLEADVNLDTRYLWEWMTEPLWSIKGKM